MDITGSTLTPVIVSASRETDLPCFFSDWFLERLKEGWCAWKNTYSGTIHKVSFAKTRMIVFWSKNPRPLLRRLDEVEALGYKQYYFQFTLNDYEREGLEPNVAPLEERIDTFRELADRIGKERVIWRFDPLMLGCAAGTKPGPPVCGAAGTKPGPPVCGAAGTKPGPPVCAAGTKPGPPVCGAADTAVGPPSLSIDALLERIGNIGRQLKGYTEKLVFSFIDIGAYKKVQRNLEGLGVREFSSEEQRRFAQGLAELNKELGLELATCGEEADLSAYGVRHNKCVDDELMMRLFHDDAVLMDFIGAEYDMFSGWHIPKSKKDKGQRKACGCIVSKDIGMYNTCPHLCRYCYANANDAQVLANFARHRQYSLSPLLVPEDKQA